MRIRKEVLLGVLAITAAIILLVLAAVQSAKEVVRRSWSRNHLMQISVALQAYHQEHGCFPPAYFIDKDGRRVHSWRVLLLPYLDQRSLYSRYTFDKPWSSSVNVRLAKPMPLQYSYPVDVYDHIDPQKATTSYVAVVGTDTMWPGQESAKMRPESSDGDRILIVELPESDIQWMEPRDVTAQGLLDLIQRKKDTGDTNGINYVTTSGMTGTLDCNIDRELLLKLLVRDLPENGTADEFRDEF